jgi:hypothetical protein
VVADSADAGQCRIPGKVDDLSDCTYSAVHSLNHHHVNPVVRLLVRTAFFRYFKVGELQKKPACTLDVKIPQLAAGAQQA